MVNYAFAGVYIGWVPPGLLVFISPPYKIFWMPAFAGSSVTFDDFVSPPHASIVPWRAIFLIDDEIET